MLSGCPFLWHPQQQLSELAETCPSLNSCGLELSIESPYRAEEAVLVTVAVGLMGMVLGKHLWKTFPWPHDYGMPRDATLLSRTF